MEVQLEKSARGKNVQPELWLGFVNSGFGLGWPAAFKPGSHIDIIAATPRPYPAISPLFPLCYFNLYLLQGRTTT